MANLEQIRNNLALLSDPRKPETKSKYPDLIKNTPASAVMMYSIHGDELSGCDASMGLAYQLAAGMDEETNQLLENLVIIIYPMENPDGRERYLSQIYQWYKNVPSSDVQSVQHTGIWPWGRTNHYLFDLNRDWFINSQPETQARVDVLNEWNPQLVVDAHEMGSYSTYLFNPPREPINHHVHPTIRQWWDVFAQDQAKAFDQYGWSYYTGEWLEDWYPGYGSSYPCYRGAVGILYEQASTDGSPVKKPNETIATFFDAVQHQFVSSIANLTTAAKNREKLITDFYLIRKQAVEEKSRNDFNTFILNPSGNESRALKFIDRLHKQGIEVHVAEKDFKINNAFSYKENKKGAFNIEKGAYVIYLDQPLRLLIESILEPDPRLKTDFLKNERESLLKGEGTRLYEVSSWSLPYAYNLNSYTVNNKPNVATVLYEEDPKFKGKIINEAPLFGFLIEYTDDHATKLLSDMLNSGLKVRVAKKPVTIENRAYERGTLLLLNNENPKDFVKTIKKLISDKNITVFGVNTGLSQNGPGPDLGGGEFELLYPPKTAILAGPPIDMYNFGSLWYLMDYELELPLSIIHSDYIANADLRKYNVLILPSVWGGAGSFKDMLKEQGLENLKNWIKGGGTIITMDVSGVFLADSSSAISKTQLRRQALKKLDVYENAVIKEAEIKNVKIDSLTIWKGKKTEKIQKEKITSQMDLDQLKMLDREQRLFMPRGTILRVKLNPEHWLCFGAGESVPAIFYSNYAFMSKPPVQTAGRFASSEELRLSGLIWPEARERWQKTAYLTRESYGKGQIIIFADQPNFRSYFYGTSRLFLNAVLLGPGLGTNQAVPF